MYYRIFFLKNSTKLSDYWKRLQKVSFLFGFPDTTINFKKKSEFCKLGLMSMEIVLWVLRLLYKNSPKSVEYLKTKQV